MARQFDLYRVSDTSEASADYFNEVHEDLDLRLHSVEQKASGWDTIVTEFTELGLQRLEQALTPLYEQISGAVGSVAELIQVGTYFSVPSLSAAIPGAGEQQFVVGEDLREKFSPAYYITAFKSDDPLIFMSGYLISYNRTTGVLKLNIDRFNGSASISSWTLTPTVEVAALQQATQAKDAAISAQGSALTYASQASSYSTQANLSLQAANSAKQEAATSAKNALSYVSQSESARNAALTAKGNAETAASNAATTYSSVLAAANNIFNTYLGEFASDPTTGRNGAALQPGMLYYNTTLSKTKFYTGTVWSTFDSTQFLSLAGGTVSGPITLPGAPTQPNHAANRQYSDDAAVAMAIALG